MTRIHKAIAAGIGLAIAALTLSGCAAVRELLAEVPVDIPGPTALPTALPAALPTVLPTPDAYEKMYQGGNRPDGLTDDEWATKSTRRITAAAALHKILVYSVDHTEGSDALTVQVKGDPDDPQLLADIEKYVVPVALAWSPSVTFRIDPSLCQVLADLRDDALCATLTD